MMNQPNIKLKLILIERGITQRDLAFGSHIDESRISKIINGYEKATFEMKESIAEFLGMERKELFPE